MVNRHSDIDQEAKRDQCGKYTLYTLIQDRDPLRRRDEAIAEVTHSLLSSRGHECPIATLAHAARCGMTSAPAIVMAMHFVSQVELFLTRNTGKRWFCISPTSVSCEIAYLTTELLAVRIALLRFLLLQTSSLGVPVGASCPLVGSMWDRGTVASASILNTARGFLFALLRHYRSIGLGVGYLDFKCRLPCRCQIWFT